MITDGSYIRKGGLVVSDTEGRVWGHNGIPDLVHLFEQFTDHIVFTHFGSWFYKDIAAARKKLESLSSRVKVEVAYDGLELRL